MDESVIKNRVNVSRVTIPPITIPYGGKQAGTSRVKISDTDIPEGAFIYGVRWGLYTSFDTNFKMTPIEVMAYFGDQYTANQKAFMVASIKDTSETLFPDPPVVDDNFYPNGMYISVYGCVASPNNTASYIYIRTQADVIWSRERFVPRWLTDVF